MSANEENLLRVFVRREMRGRDENKYGKNRDCFV